MLFFYASRKTNEVVLFILFNASLISRVAEFIQKQHLQHFIDCAKIAKISNV